MAKLLIFVVVPYTVDPSRIYEYSSELLNTHEMSGDRSSGHFDYRCGIGPVFNDPITEGRLPKQSKRVLHRRICSIQNLPAEPTPHVLLTSDGVWHTYLDTPSDSEQYWNSDFTRLIGEQEHCWIVAHGAHF